MWWFLKADYMYVPVGFHAHFGAHSDCNQFIDLIFWFLVAHNFLISLSSQISLATSSTPLSSFLLVSDLTQLIILLFLTVYSIMSGFPENMQSDFWVNFFNIVSCTNSKLKRFIAALLGRILCHFDLFVHHMSWRGQNIWFVLGFQHALKIGAHFFFFLRKIRNSDD